MNEATRYINMLSDRIQDTKKANTSLYLIAMAIAHGEGTATDYSDALTLLYETIANQISDQQGLIAEVTDIINKKGE